MAKAIIQIIYRQIIDASSQSDFEKNILHFSYQEYKMKSQAYNTESTVNTFTDLKAKDGRANSLHYKSGFAIGGFVDGLKNQIPHLKDTLGKAIVFETYQFEVIESDITNRFLHKVAIHYITGWFTLHLVMGEAILLSKADNMETDFCKPLETFMLKIQDGLSIMKYKELPSLQNE